MQKKVYYKDSYMSYKINCDDRNPCYLGILSCLLTHLNYSINRFYEPIGYHIRIRPKNGIDNRSITDRLNKFYSKPNKHRKKAHTFDPVWVKVQEMDPDQDGYHMHLAVILDLNKAKRISLDYFCSNLLKNNIIDSYLVIEPDLPTDRKGVLLKNEGGFARYFYWLSYIAKSRTKEFTPQTFSSSRLDKAS
ncbi:hypothetical protein DIT71_03275 [Marinobacter vulgaris]|uniref:Inovirus Gp2 family protein n=1 Tax=Marinobacter vulgaris TaxID=1928331 RepID=A0A2V3ZMB8_9GAMM|nr:hypothetical protein [Marinobacter vulgaris]PXX92242.1 hypothetical protein DIT71_03275 [Marinobacter vulgaris]TSJ71815.1 hypothetical protein FPC41_06190 [Marinobacter vulgaris]